MEIQNAKHRLMGKKCIIFAAGTHEVGIFQGEDDENYFFFDPKKGTPFFMAKVAVSRIEEYRAKGGGQNG